MKSKRVIAVVIFLLSILAGSIFLLNVEVTTRQGINYKVQTLRIPLYLKILDFYDRHYNYKWLVGRIIRDKASDEEKAMAIFRWTIENIAEQPEELRVVDDHVYNIIVRGYGAGDQFSDVFTTLCNYAGVDAFFYRLRSKRDDSLATFSFVKINGKWCVFEPRAGVYFVKEADVLASVEDIALGNWTVKDVGMRGNIGKSQLKYSDYLDGVLKINFERAHRWSRANIQSPVNRLIYEIKKRQLTSEESLPDE